MLGKCKHRRLSIVCLHLRLLHELQQCERKEKQCELVADFDCLAAPMPRIKACSLPPGWTWSAKPCHWPLPMASRCCRPPALCGVVSFVPACLAAHFRQSSGAYPSSSWSNNPLSSSSFQAPPALTPRRQRKQALAMRPRPRLCTSCVPEWGGEKRTCACMVK